MTDWDKYPNFTKYEMACKHCGECHMNEDFMDRLQALRTVYGSPLPVTSGYRCGAHNKAVGGGVAHPLGRAADISISRQSAYRLLKLALDSGFTGIGLKQHGDKRFIHLDDLTAIQTVPRPTVWTYD